MLSKYLIFFISLLISQSLVAQISISVPDTTKKPDKELVLPIYISDLTGKDIRSYYFELNYDKSLLKAKSISDKNTVSDRKTWELDAGFTNDGLFVQAWGRRDLKGGGVLIFIKFEVIAEEGFTELILEPVYFNNSLNDINVTNGSFRVYVEKIVKFDKAGDGDGQISIDGEKFELPFEKTMIQGKAYEIASHPDNFSNFSFWSGGLEGNNSSEKFTVQSSTSIIAHFNIKSFSVSAGVLPSTYGTVEGMGIYKMGDVAHLTAIPNSGKQFLNWTQNGDIVSNEGNYEFIVSSNVELTANFVNNLFQITATIDPIEAGQIIGAGYYFIDQVAIIEAKSNSNWVFKNWTENNEIISQDSIISIIVTSDRSLIANFELVTDINDEQEILTNNFLAPYPNPFNPQTNFRFTLSSSSKVSLVIFDTIGRTIKSIYQSDLLHKGIHNVQFDGSGLSSGVYIYYFTSNDLNNQSKLVKSGKILLVK